MRLITMIGLTLTVIPTYSHAQTLRQSMPSNSILLPLNSILDKRCRFSVHKTGALFDPRNVRIGSYGLGRQLPRNPVTGRLGPPSPAGSDPLPDTRGRFSVESDNRLADDGTTTFRLSVSSPSAAKVVWISGKTPATASRPSAIMTARDPSRCRFDAIEVYASRQSAWSRSSLETLSHCEAGVHRVMRFQGRCNIASSYPTGRALYILKRGRNSSAWLADFDGMKASRFAKPYIPFAMSPTPEFPHNPN